MLGRSGSHPEHRGALSAGYLTVAALHSKLTQRRPRSSGLQAPRESGCLSGYFQALCLGWSVNILLLPSDIAEFLPSFAATCTRAQTHTHTHTLGPSSPQLVAVFGGVDLNNAKEPQVEIPRLRKRALAHGSGPRAGSLPHIPGV